MVHYAISMMKYAWDDLWLWQTQIKNWVKFKVERCFTINGLSLFFPEISHNVLYEIVSVWSTKFQKTYEWGGFLKFWPKSTKTNERWWIVNHIITGAETWISHNTPKTNWMASFTFSYLSSPILPIHTCRSTEGHLGALTYVCHRLSWAS